MEVRVEGQEGEQTGAFEAEVTAYARPEDGKNTMLPS